MSRVRQPTFIVEYDLPMKPPGLRRSFYRAIHRELKNRAESGDPVAFQWSTGSVIFTSDERFAWFVFREARDVTGMSHIYEALRLDGDPEFPLSRV